MALPYTFRLSDSALKQHNDLIATSSRSDEENDEFFDAMDLSNMVSLQAEEAADRMLIDLPPGRIQQKKQANPKGFTVIGNIRERSIKILRLIVTEPQKY